MVQMKILITFDDSADGYIHMHHTARPPKIIRTSNVCRKAALIKNNTIYNIKWQTTTVEKYKNSQYETNICF